jgi:hypothetical protein
MDVDPPPPISPVDHDNIIPFEPEFPKPPPSLPPPLTASGGPNRQHRLPRRFTDNLPEVLAPLPTCYASEPGVPLAGPARCVLLIVRDKLVMAANSFGVWLNIPTVLPLIQMVRFLWRTCRILIGLPQIYLSCHHLQNQHLFCQTLTLNICFIGQAKTPPSGELWHG